MSGKAARPGKKNSLWTPELDSNLIDLVKAAPMLWDVRDQLYIRSDLKRMEWHSIAGKLHPQFDGSLVSSHFENIKATWSRNMRKVESSKRSGAGQESVFKPRWELFDRLGFLKANRRTAPTISNLNLPDSEPVGFEEHGDDFDQKDDLSQLDADFNIGDLSQDDEVEVYEVEADEVPTEESIVMNDSDHAYAQTDGNRSVNAMGPPVGAFFTKTSLQSGSLYEKRGSKRRGSGTGFLSDAVSALQNLSQQEVLPPPVLDGSDHFGSYVAIRLRSLPEQERMQYELSIVNILATPYHLLLD